MYRYWGDLLLSLVSTELRSGHTYYVYIGGDRADVSNGVTAPFGCTSGWAALGA